MKSKHKKITAIVALGIFLIIGSVLELYTTKDEKIKELEEKIAQLEIQVSTQEAGGVVLGDNTEDEEQTLEEDEFFITEVVDGDTIKLQDGRSVRYIGVDTPETKHPTKGVECFGQEATNKNKELVEGKIVRLEKDVSETDRYDRLLRYVYVDDVFVNDILVKDGFAHASTYPPDVKHQEQFDQSQKEAREQKRGLWADDACLTFMEKVGEQASEKESIELTEGEGGQQYKCDCEKTCTQISSCQEAQFQLNECGCTDRDGNGDGLACGSQCTK
ncbi:MAG: thermonuclease family protein [Candidatus Moranbacteria bacterium]|nr:thermonuclease family protein [Candidatus Moranbacteria bacterium]